MRSSRLLAVTTASVVCGDELLEDRSDLLAPLAAVEDAVMADVLGHEILLLGGRQPGRDVERRLGLADPRNIVALALDRQQRRVPDRLRLHHAPTMLHFTFRQQVLLE